MPHSLFSSSCLFFYLYRSLKCCCSEVSFSNHLSFHYAQRFLTFWLRLLKQSVENSRIFPFQNIGRCIHTKFSVKFHNAPEARLRICHMHSSLQCLLSVSFVSFKQMNSRSFKFILASLLNLRYIFFLRGFFPHGGSVVENPPAVQEIWRCRFDP